MVAAKGIVSHMNPKERVEVLQLGTSGLNLFCLDIDT